MFAFGLNGRIRLVDERELRLMSDDTTAEFVLQFTPEMEFGYADSRQVTGPEAEDYDSSIAVFFGPGPRVGTPDSVIFAVKR